MPDGTVREDEFGRTRQQQPVITDCVALPFMLRDRDVMSSDIKAKETTNSNEEVVQRKMASGSGGDNVSLQANSGTKKPLHLTGEVAAHTTGNGKSISKDSQVKSPKKTRATCPSGFVAPRVLTLAKEVSPVARPNSSTKRNIVFAQEGPKKPGKIIFVVDEADGCSNLVGVLRPVIADILSVQCDYSDYYYECPLCLNSSDSTATLTISVADMKSLEGPCFFYKYNDVLLYHKSHVRPRVCLDGCEVSIGADRLSFYDLWHKNMDGVRSSRVHDDASPDEVRLSKLLRSDSGTVYEIIDQHPTRCTRDYIQKSHKNSANKKQPVRKAAAKVPETPCSPSSERLAIALDFFPCQQQQIQDPMEIARGP